MYFICSSNKLIIYRFKKSIKVFNVKGFMEPFYFKTLGILGHPVCKVEPTEKCNIYQYVIIVTQKISNLLISLFFYL